MSPYCHARGSSTFSASKGLPHTIRSNLAFAITVPNSFLVMALQQCYPNNLVQCLLLSQPSLTSAPISGVAVGPPFVFKGIPPLFVSRNHPVLSLWPVNNGFVVCRRMTWKESISWPLLKKMIQVGGYFPPRMTPTTPTTSKEV